MKYKENRKMHNNTNYISKQENKQQKNKPI